ncbi:MAG: hypothetical protein LUF90_03955 [Rikenellaceae bacterium]|nr:hypothetical protein [Rikenellaceae bacterium]
MPAKLMLHNDNVKKYRSFLYFAYYITLMTIALPEDDYYTNPVVGIETEEKEE